MTGPGIINNNNNNNNNTYIYIYVYTCFLNYNGDSYRLITYSKITSVLVVHLCLSGPLELKSVYYPPYIFYRFI